MKRYGRILAGCIGVLSGLMILSRAAGNVVAGSISDAEQEKDQLEQQLLEAQELIDSLGDSQEDLEDNVRSLDEKLTEISEQITSLEEQRLEKETQIQDTQLLIQEAQADVDTQYEAMKLRIQFMYENSLDSMLQQFLEAQSISDFLNRAEFINELSIYDRKMLQQYQDTVTYMTELEHNLELEEQELAELKEQVAQEEAAVATLIQEKENQLAQVGQELTEAQQLALVYEAEIQAQEEIIALIQKQEEERIRQEEEERIRQEQEASQEGGSQQDTTEDPKKPEVTQGTFVWPCPSSTRVTSDYGPRKSPTAGASSYHRGIDVGAAHGSDIVAAAAGTVSFTGYSNSSGNYLTISHGDGLYTVYMHCSSIVAAKGDVVSAGQVVAKVGNTGISTASHLHFGVSLNGSYVSPWDYLR